MALFLLLSWRRVDGALRKANIDEAMIPYLSPGARAISRFMMNTDLELVHDDLDSQSFVMHSTTTTTRLDEDLTFSIAGVTLASSV